VVTAIGSEVVVVVDVVVVAGLMQPVTGVVVVAPSLVGGHKTGSVVVGPTTGTVVVALRTTDGDAATMQAHTTRRSGPMRRMNDHASQPACTRTVGSTAILGRWVSIRHARESPVEQTSGS
jgi:hypothetical protein